MFVQNMVSLAVAIVVTVEKISEKKYRKKNIEKKKKNLKFYKMSKYHIFGNLIFSILRCPFKCEK